MPFHCGCWGWCHGKGGYGYVAAHPHTGPATALRLTWARLLSTPTLACGSVGGVWLGTATRVSHVHPGARYLTGARWHQGTGGGCVRGRETCSLTDLLLAATFFLLLYSPPRTFRPGPQLPPGHHVRQAGALRRTPHRHDPHELIPVHDPSSALPL
jgi:hypothetical protein